MNSYQLRDNVTSALIRAGERECRTRKASRAGLLRYVAEDPGFRFHHAYERPLSVPAVTTAFEYLGVSEHGNKMADLRRLEGILNRAGFPTMICGTTLRQVKRVWVNVPIHGSLDRFLCGWMRGTHTPDEVKEYARDIADVFLQERMTPEDVREEMIDFPGNLLDPVMARLASFQTAEETDAPYPSDRILPELAASERRYHAALYRAIRAGGPCDLLDLNALKAHNARTRFQP